MITLMHLPIRRGNAPLRIARGHFATNHSHINYFVDITFQKTRLSEAKGSAKQLVAPFVNDTPVDTILCPDGTSVLGTCLAEELTKSGFYTINAHQMIPRLSTYVQRIEHKMPAGAEPAGISFSVGIRDFSPPSDLRFCYRLAKT